MKYSRSAALLGLAAVSNAQFVPAICPTGPVVVPTAVVYPLYINTYIAANTVFNINGGANITINNAPTSLQTTVTATSTVFSTVTTTVTGGTAPTATTVNQPIILAINAPGVKNRRQNAFSGYLGPGGSIVSTCSGATPLNLISGQLFTTTGGQFSTSPGVSSQPFAANPVVGPITTLFGSNGNFVWQNQAFTGGAASFCLASNNQAIVSFTTSPAGCSPITFRPILASSCPGGATGTSSGTVSATSSGASSASSGSSSTRPTSSASSSVASSSGASSGTSSATSAPASTGAITQPTGSPPAGSTPVQISFPAPGTTKEKRQGQTQYLTATGQYTTDKSQAATFGLYQGQLYSGSTPISTNPNTQNMIFAAMSPIGSITTSFSLNGGLTWSNAAFTINGAGNTNANFAVSGGYLYAAFQSLPPGAQQVALSASPVASSTSSATPTATPSGNSTVRKRFNAYHLQAQHLQEV